jgi:hypothetical protein
MIFNFHSAELICHSSHSDTESVCTITGVTIMRYMLLFLNFVSLSQTGQAVV